MYAPQSTAAQLSQQQHSQAHSSRRPALVCPSPLPALSQQRSPGQLQLSQPRPSEIIVTGCTKGTSEHHNVCLKTDTTNPIQRSQLDSRANANANTKTPVVVSSCDRILEFAAVCQFSSFVTRGSFTIGCA